MNNKSTFILFLICGLALSALVLRDGKLLLLAMPFLVFLIGGILASPGEARLLARRIIEKPNFVTTESVETRIEIENQGKDLANLIVEDPLFASTTLLAGQVRQRLSLPAGGRTELSHALRAGRGVYSWSAILATASDPFGLFEIKSELPCPAEAVVRPASRRLRHIPLRPRFTLHAAGPVSARLGGPGTDFFGIREYRPGDTLRRLNWRLAARHPRKLFANEYEREEIADFGLILDARKLTDADAMEAALFETSIDAAASLSETFLKEGNRVALLIFGKTMTSLVPGYGKRQLNLILRSLARASLGSNLSFEHLEYFPARLFPGRAILVMFSVVDPRDLETYARLRSFGYEILLISPNPVDYAAHRLPPAESNSLAVRAARLERVILLNRLMKLGVQVIDWQTGQPLEKAVQKTARYMARRRDV